MRIRDAGGRVWSPAAVVLAAWCVARAATAAEAPAEGAGSRSGLGASAPLVRVQQGEGGESSGRLERIGAEDVRLIDAAGATVTLPVERVRAVRRVEAAEDGPHGIRLTLVDGSTLSGDEFTWDGTRAMKLVRPEGVVEIPAVRIRSVALLPEASAGGRWQAAIPEGASTDLVVVGNADAHEFVECAITAVTPETITVILDDETIPVKRTKVIGMQWLRPDAGDGRGRFAVAVAGGTLRGDGVDWSPAGLVVDGDIRLPSSMLLGIDYASGRTVALADLVAEKVAVEPWFGGLGRGDGLDAFFAPRAVATKGAAGRPDAAAASSLIVRPRTIATWRLPPDSRRFRAVLVAAGGNQAADAVVVAVSVDDRELLRRQVDAAASVAAADGASVVGGIPVDLDVTGGRRLTVTVDYASAGGIGGPVLISHPVIER